MRKQDSYTLTTYDVNTFICSSCEKEYAIGMEVTCNRDWKGHVNLMCVYCWNIKNPRDRKSVWQCMLAVRKESIGVITKWEV